MTAAGKEGLGEVDRLVIERFRSVGADEVKDVGRVGGTVNLGCAVLDLGVLIDARRSADFDTAGRNSDRSHWRVKKPPHSALALEAPGWMLDAMQCGSITTRAHQRPLEVEGSAIGGR